MSFIIKKFLRTFISQYLNIHDQLNLEKGEVQLPSGHLNEANINLILQSKGIPVMIAYSEYQGLGISIPIIEILSKPVVLRMESLRVVVVVHVDGQAQGQGQGREDKKEQMVEQKDSKAKIQQSEQKSAKKQPSVDPQPKNQKSYLKSIITRLVTNIEVEIKKLEITVRLSTADPQSPQRELDNKEYKLSLQNFVAKNSLSLLEANILKKIVCMTRLGVTVNHLGDQAVEMGEKGKEDRVTTIAQITDLNMCLNIDYTRVTVICLLDKFTVGLETKLIGWVAGLLKQRLYSKQAPKEQPAGSKKTIQPLKQKQIKQGESSEEQVSFQPDVEAFQLKINEIKFAIIDRAIVSSPVQLYKLSITGLQISKQKVKKLEESPPSSSNSLQKKPSTPPKSSQLALHLHSISFSISSQTTPNRPQVVVLVKMCERGDRTEGATIEGWNKKKRKQFRLGLEITNGVVEGLQLSDLEVGLTLGDELVGNLAGLLELAKTEVIQFVEWKKSQGQKEMKQELKKSDQRDMKSPMKPTSAIALPQISLTNMKVSVTLAAPSPGSSPSLAICTPDTIKLSPSFSSYTLQLLTLVVLADGRHELLKIKNIKAGYEKGPGIEEIVVSVHQVRSNLDIFAVGGLVWFVKGEWFRDWVQRVVRLVEAVATVAAMLNQPSKMSQPEHKQERMIKQSEEIPASRGRQAGNLYLRIQQVILCLGSTPKHRAASSSSSKFNPILLVELESIKGICLQAQGRLVKMNLKVCIKALAAISPHNLSHSSLLRAPIRAKVYRSGSREGESEGRNMGILLLDPLTLDIQEQHTLLIANLLFQLLRSPSPSSTIFTTIANRTNQPITFLQSTGITGSNKSMGTSKVMDMSEQRMDKEKEKDKEEWGGGMLDGYCEVAPNQTRELYLLDALVRVRINGELSQPILLALDNKDISSSTSIDDHQEEHSSRVHKSHSLNLQGQQKPVIPPQQMEEKQAGNEQVQRRQTMQISSDKSLKPAPSPSPSPKSGSFKVQKGIMFPYHEECKYILEIDYSSGHLLISVKYKYELHLFQGIQGACGLRALEIRCIKLDKFERYDAKGDDKEERVMTLAWELLDDDNIEHVTLLLHTDQVCEYKLCRLMTNSLKYKLYGLYPVQAHLQSPQPPSFHYYILEPTPSPLHSQLDSTPQHYYLMPFLVLVNNLPNNPVQLNITNKKSLQSREYRLGEGTRMVPVHGDSDYYMKQYMIRLGMQDYVGGMGSGGRELEHYESEQHYFNTFFMVDESFQNIIQLRNPKTNTRRYLRIRQSFLHKTKILQIYNCLRIQNKTDHTLELTIIPRNAGKGTGTAENNGVYRLQGHGWGEFPNKLKKDDRVRVGYLVGESRENFIEVPVQHILDNGGKILLSFNFCRLESSPKHNEEYYQILIKLQLKTISHLHQADNLAYNPSNLQVELIFTPFLVFTNLCSKGRKIRCNGTVLDTCYGDEGRGYLSLCLPSNTNKDYNNKYMGINMEQIYQDLLVCNKNWILQGHNNYMQIQLLPLPNQSPPSQPSILYLHELITHKVIEHNKSVYSLVKSLKEDRIELFFGDHLFNVNAAFKYFIFNNATDQYFLMNSTETQYAKYLLFPGNWEDEAKGKGKDKQREADGKGSAKKQQKKAVESSVQPKPEQKAQQKQPQPYDSHPITKVHIEGSNPYPANIMLNKQKYDIFLCDRQYRKLQPFTFRKIEKLKLKQERYQIENFTVLDLESQSSASSTGGTGSNQFQISTSSINIRLQSRSKNLCLVLEVKSINMRNFENDKIDLLIQDINVYVTAEQQASTVMSGNQKQDGNPPQSSQPQPPRPKLQSYQILRIPEESYLLMEQKMYDSKFILIKNIYIKCKIIDLHVNKQILAVGAHWSRVGRAVGGFFKGRAAKGKEEKEGKEGYMNREEVGKLIGLCEQKILLVRSLCIHPINLCLNIQTNPTLDISSMITIPQFTLTPKVLRVSSLSKQILNHYLTNVIAKFPKLSFIYQNLRSPLAMLRSILEARSMLAGGADGDGAAVRWGIAAVGLEKAYAGIAGRGVERCLVGLMGVNGRKSGDRQLERVNQFLLQLTLQSLQPCTQKFLTPLRNIISTNLTKLAQTNVPLTYYLTTRSLHIVSLNQSPPSVLHEQISIKEIESIKITRYNNRGGTGGTGTAELVIGFRRRGVYLKIVDQVGFCMEIFRCVNEVIL